MGHFPRLTYGLHHHSCEFLVNMGKAIKQKWGGRVVISEKEGDSVLIGAQPLLVHRVPQLSTRFQQEMGDWRDRAKMLGGFAFCVIVALGFNIQGCFPSAALLPDVCISLKHMS